MRSSIVLMLVIFIVLLSLPAVAVTEKGNITFELKKAGNVMFSHDYHTKMRGVKCSACHYQSFSASNNGFQMKRDKMTKRDFCEHCHNGLKGFDARSESNCMRCHHK